MKERQRQRQIDRKTAEQTDRDKQRVTVNRETNSQKKRMRRLFLPNSRAVAFHNHLQHR